MQDLRALLMLPLFYLTITSGLPPGLGITDPPPYSLTSVRTQTPSLSSSNLSATETTAAPTRIAGSGVVSSSRRKNLRTSLPMVSSASTEEDAAATVATTLPASSGTRIYNNQEEMHVFTAETPVISPLVQNITKVRLRGKCFSSIQCIGEWTECRYNVCRCMSGYLPRSDNGDLCGEESLHHVQLPQTDPTMIGVVVGLALMSVTLCVVLRLFAKARFRENRTIFNTPNPRLMNVSLISKGSKPLVRGNSAPRSRRGSTISARSGAEAGTTPPSPNRHLPPGHDGASGSVMIPLAGSSRPKPSRQLSTDTVHTAEGTPPVRPASAHHKHRMRHQDSVASNV